MRMTIVKPIEWSGVAVLALLLACADRGEVSEVSMPEENRSLSDFMREETKQYSQFNEELLIRYFFKDRRDGFFVDLGAYWPDRLSTTFYLEKDLGWRGIAIDALPEYEPAWKATRPATPFFNFAVTDKSGETITFYRAVEPGISSIYEEVVTAWEGPLPEVVDALTITLDDLLDSNGIAKIDFLSIDIEGAEPLALAGFDIERFRPELVCVEAHTTKEIEVFLMDYFTQHGYERIEAYLSHDIVNWYFRPAD